MTEFASELTAIRQYEYCRGIRDLRATGGPAALTFEIVDDVIGAGGLGPLGAPAPCTWPTRRSQTSGGMHERPGAPRRCRWPPMEPGVRQDAADELPLTIEDAELETGYEGTRSVRFPAHGATAEVPSLGLPVS